jgi:hypothetical protein
MRSSAGGAGTRRGGTTLVDEDFQGAAAQCVQTDQPRDDDRQHSHIEEDVPGGEDPGERQRHGRGEDCPDS